MYEDIKWYIQGMLFSIVVSIDLISECYEGLQIIGGKA